MSVRKVSLFVVFGTRWLEHGLADLSPSSALRATEESK